MIAVRYYKLRKNFQVQIESIIKSYIHQFIFMSINQHSILTIFIYQILKTINSSKLIYLLITLLDQLQSQIKQFFPIKQLKNQFCRIKSLNTMKINFETIEQDLNNSTLASSLIVPSQSSHQQSNPIKIYSSFSHSLIVDPSVYEKKTTNFSKYDFKAHKKQIQSPKLFSSQQKKSKIPKKFSNIKTIQEMQSFINQMNRNQSDSWLIQSSKIKNKIGLNQLDINLSRSNINIKDLSDKKQKVKLLTSRLNQTFKGKQTNSFCMRKSCRQIISTVQKKLTEDFQNFTGQPNIDRIKKIRTLSSSKLCQSLDISINHFISEQSNEQILISEQNEVHERLFKDAQVRKDYKQKVERNFQQKCIELSRSLQAKRNLCSSSQKHLSTSRGFYQRLAELTERQKNRSKLAQIVNSTQSYLINKKIHKKYKFSLTNQTFISTEQLQKKALQKSQMLSKNPTKCTKSKCHQTQEHIKSQQFIHTQQKPQISDKTKQIMYHQENELIQKIKALFYDKKTKKVKINAAKIYTLSESEFSILFQLIRKVQNKSRKAITLKKLEEMITNFYHSLGFSDKQQLRRIHMLCEPKLKDKRCENDSKVKEMAKSKKTGKKAQQTDKNMTDCSSFDAEVDYCARLAMYV